MEALTTPRSESAVQATSLDVEEHDDLCIPERPSLQHAQDQWKIIADAYTLRPSPLCLSLPLFLPRFLCTDDAEAPIASPDLWARALLVGTRFSIPTIADAGHNATGMTVIVPPSPSRQRDSSASTIILTLQSLPALRSDRNNTSVCQLYSTYSGLAAGTLTAFQDPLYFPLAPRAHSHFFVVPLKTNYILTPPPVNRKKD